MNKYFYIILILVLTTSSVFAQKLELTKIDGSTNDSFTASLQKLTELLNKKEQYELQIAILKINLEGISGVKKAMEKNKLQGKPTSETISKLHGLTFKEIIALAASSNSVSISLAGQEPGLSEGFKKPLETTTNTSIIKLSDSSWAFTTNINGHIKQKTFKFMPDGILKYIIPKQDKETSKKLISRWQQEGNNIRISFNNDYSIYLGSIESDILMTGKSTNINGSNWIWKAEIVDVR